MTKEEWIQAHDNITLVVMFLWPLFVVGLLMLYVLVISPKLDKWLDERKNKWLK